jgi:hypothetical protein
MIMAVIATVCGFAVRWVRRLCFVAAALFVADAVAFGQGGIPRPEEFTPAFAEEPAYDVTNVQYTGVNVAEPLWTAYALTDALFWGRDNQAGNVPLVVTQNPAATPLLNAQDLQFPFSEGVRAFYGQRQPCECGWELGYWGVYGQSATGVIAAPPGQFIQFPGDIGEQLTADAERATVKYQSTINSAEANIFSTEHHWHRDAGAWHTTDWLVGFRYVGVEERASIEMDCCIVDNEFITVPYGVGTRNNMFGAQVGRRARWDWNRWSIENWAKAGILGNAQEQYQNALVDFEGFQWRPARSTFGSSVGFIGDMNLSAIYRLTEVWGIRAGYNLIWIDGLALAPNQFDFTNTETSGTLLASGGGIFMHGANLGLEARW